MKFGILLLLTCCLASAQNFSRRDSLQGGMRKERSCFDVRRYDLSIKVNPATKTIQGYNDITFITTEPTNRIQLDLFENMQIDSIVMAGKRLNYKRDHAAVFITMNLANQTRQQLRFYYSGIPKEALNAPWDGGFVFSTDRRGKPWIGVAVQGTGASLWFPVKDTQTDEPEEGASIDVEVPDGLMNISNGRLVSSRPTAPGYTSWKWEVKNPINNYDITLNIADYVLITDTHRNIDLHYYVLRENEQIAKQHFADVKPMLDCFEGKFGEFPFKDDGFKLIETPYLGMEHQSAIAYGNKYKKGYLGGDMSGTGIALRFDYIIIHEAGHEWFGNSITTTDIADMWIHEGFTTYAESVFVECLYGYGDAQKYLKGQRNLISNDEPIIGPYGVNKQGSGDMYYKGALMLHTMRYIVNNDNTWWALLKQFAEQFKHQIINTQDVLQYFNAASGLSFDAIFRQYLTTTMIPSLVFEQEANKVRYRLTHAVEGFTLPLNATCNGQPFKLQPTNQWQYLEKNPATVDGITVDTKGILINIKK